MIKQLTVYTKGDSADINSWSNIPYCFTRELESRGIAVNRVDINPSRALKWVYDRTWLRFLRCLHPKTDFSYTRGAVHFLDVKRKIRRALRQFGEADANIFITFGFSSAGLTSKPTILFYDWPYHYYFHYHFQKQPDVLERGCIERERQQIENADLVVTLYPSVLEYMRHRYVNENIRYFGNVINAIQAPDQFDILRRKASSQSLLFIGKKKYAEGAQLLIRAYGELTKQFPNLRLHIIGMKGDAVKIAPRGVEFHGYLDKGNQEQQELYYSLLKEAKVLVLGSGRWGGFSAMLEAMFFYVPVVVPPYQECLAMFGNALNFGYFFEEDSVESLCSRIKAVLEHESYETLCLNARAAVISHTWASFVDQLIRQIEAMIARQGNSAATLKNVIA